MGPKEGASLMARLVVANPVGLKGNWICLRKPMGFIPLAKLRGERELEEFAQWMKSAGLMDFDNRREVEPNGD